LVSVGGLDGDPLDAEGFFEGEELAGGGVAAGVVGQRDALDPVAFAEVVGVDAVGEDAVAQAGGGEEGAGLEAFDEGGGGGEGGGTGGEGSAGRGATGGAGGGDGRASGTRRDGGRRRGCGHGNSFESAKADVCGAHRRARRQG